MRSKKPQRRSGERDAGERSPAPSPAPPRTRAESVFALQRNAGNAVVARAVAPRRGGHGVVQRVVLKERLAPDTIEKLSKEFGETIVDDLQAFHNVLLNSGQTKHFLTALEDRVKAHLSESGNKYTRALAKALAEGEAWMRPPPSEGKAHVRIEVSEGTVTTEALVSYLNRRQPLKDIGAPISHGEWAHRIQLWILSRWAKEHDMNASRLYNALKVVDAKSAAFPEEAPAVWSWVLDIPNNLTLARPNEVPVLPGAEVGSAAPVRLTLGLTGVGAGEEIPAITQVGAIRRALLNRRLKRFVEARAEQAKLAPEFTNLEAVRKLVNEGSVTEQQVKAVTTPGSGPKTAFEDKEGAWRRSPEITDWVRDKAYVSWMERQDVSLRKALALLPAAKGELLGDLGGVVEALATPYNQPYQPVGVLTHEQRDRIVVALVSAGGL